MYCRGDGVQLLYNCMYPDACSLLCNILFSVILKTNIDFKIESEDSIEWRMVLQRKTLHSMVSNLMLIIVKVGGDLERRNSWGSTLYSASSAIRSSSKSALKVLTNEKRGGFTVVSVDRSRFKLFSRKCSHKLLQATSCERHKTAPRTLFLSFANYTCFPITL